MCNSHTSVMLVFYLATVLQLKHKRYKEKLQIIDNIDPYELPEDERVDAVELCRACSHTCPCLHVFNSYSKPVH